MRVTWTTPDIAKQNAAAQWMVTFENRGMRHADIDAVIVHHGTMISDPVHVAAHKLRQSIRGSLPESIEHQVPERWVCLVACDDGGRIIEKNPLDLTVVDEPNR